MGISASAAQHHIKKLMELGLVALSHTRRVRGITASYYAHAENHPNRRDD
jgi:DNA-binding transcriptional ArsR family regulator